ncbi:MAG TPA: CBS domain-containing protein [Phycisphaerae bacterium]|nr:CBS domain-containing protein [Phycisphaerae bacterium]
MKVEDYMLPHPLTVLRNETVKRIEQLIHEHGIQQLPVVDNANRLVGIVTDRDVRSAGNHGEPDEFPLVAADIMTRDVISTYPGAELSEVVDELFHHGFGALPVVIGDQVVGMIGTHELLGCLKNMLEDDDVKVAARSLATYAEDIL